MPELPEVETTRRGIAAYVENHIILQVRVRDGRLRWPVPAELQTQLENARILSIQRRGKYLIFTTDHGCMLLHLGMSGSLRIETNGHEPRKHDHVEWILDNGHILRFHDPRRFGSVHWLEYPPEQHPLLRDLGPEPLTAGFDGSYLHNVSRRHKTAIKNFIMNSKIVVGIGNIYANEALFLAGILPGRPANHVTEQRYRNLAKSIKNVLKKAIRQGGTTLRDFVNADGKPGYFRQRLHIYEKAGQDCGRCGTTIRHKVIGQRSSYYCPKCQR